MRKRTKKTTTARPAKTSRVAPEKLPLIDHLHELKRRLFYVVACVAVGSAVAYGLERKLIAILLRPSNGQQFIYTSPIGGMNFLFSVCLDIGLVLATPVIIYQLLAFLQPIMRGTSRRFLLLAAGSAFIVAIAGVLFGYFVGLPSALHFLLHQFTTVQVRPLITIQAYMQFVSLYLFGSALMFQLPLILIIINRIKPLKPSKLFKYERHLIVGALIVAFIMNPTPNIVDQMMVVVPIILMYQVGIALIWFVNRRTKPGRLELLRAEDAARQAERARRALTPLTLPALEPMPVKPTISEPAAALSATMAPALSRTSTGFARTVRRGNYLPLRGQLVQ